MGKFKTIGEFFGLIERHIKVRIGTKHIQIFNLIFPE